MKLPKNISDYLNPKISTFNPENIGYKFFVYGTFPLVLNKLLAITTLTDNYNLFTIQGRMLSAFFDLLIIILVYKTTKLLFPNKKNLPLWAAFFYAIAVYPIQASHFFTTDTFLNFFMFGSFYFALRFYFSSSVRNAYMRSLRYIILSAIFFGLALACKVTALFILPLNLFFMIKTVFGQRQSFFKTIFFVVLYFLFSYFALRFADPYLFQNPNFFNPQLSQNFISNLKSLQASTVKDMMNNWYPPMVQWLNKNTALHSLVNNVVFGMGIPFSILVLVGIGWIISNIKSKNHELIVILSWVLGFFVYQSLQITPTLRYFIIIYPFLAIFAALGINLLMDYGLRITDSKLIRNSSFVILIIILLIWPLMFSSIYLHKHTRVEASDWIYKNLPSGSIILGEYWDDPLPLSVINSYGKQFTIEQLPVFDSDTPEKWQKMNKMLDKADYYVLSSNRGWGSIMTVPEKYPKMSKFYNELLSNKNPDYKKIKEFVSYPNFSFFIFHFSFPDDWADEGFTVYDHPKVLIYKNVKKS